MVLKIQRKTPYSKYLCLYIFVFLLVLPPCLDYFQTPTTTAPTSTTIHHLLFSLASSSDSFPRRKRFIRLWYNPNITRAYVFQEKSTPSISPLDTTLPGVVTYGDTSNFPYTFPGGSRSAVRIARIIKEAVELNETNVHWFVFGDDDTLFFTDNLVRTLSKYDHNHWYYVGSNSECFEQNQVYSFDMAFGGGGFAISYPLAKALAKVMDSCLMRYPHLYGSDARVFSCLAELGVVLTYEPGFHQVDVWGDLFGMLTAHPLSPLVSLHHVTDFVKPIFPNMTRFRAMEHLFKAADADPARILQQTVCYDRTNSLTVSIAWGYAVQVFEGNHLLPDLLSLQETFKPWKICYLSKQYMFNIRKIPKDPCKRPVVFFFRSLLRNTNNEVWTDYVKHHNADNCLRSTLMQNIQHIRVSSQKLTADITQLKTPLRQCCDILRASDKSRIKINLRLCGTSELISMDT